MPNDSKVLEPYNVLSTPSLDATPLLYAGSGLTSIETNRTLVQRLDKGTTPDGPKIGKTIAAVEKEVGFEQESQANTDVLETETQEHIESFLQNFESIHRDWEEFKLLGYNRKSPQVNQEAITELKKTATELRQHKDQQVIDKATEILSLLDNFPQKDINALVSRKLAHDNEKERGKAVVMVAHVNASIAMLQDGLETLAHSRQRNLSQKVKEKTRDAVIAQTLTHLSQGKEDQEALTESLQTILDEDKGPLAKKLTKAQSSEFEATCITEAEKLREKAHSLQETATRVSRSMIKVRGFLGNVHKSPISIENRAKAEKFLANSSNLLKELSNDISDSAQALSPQKSTISKVGASVGNSLIKALVAFDNPDYALESAANMVEKGGKSIAMGANALRSTAIYGIHKTTQAANTKKINHLETAEQIVDSTARAFLNQMLGAQEHITRSVDPFLSTLMALIKEDEKLKEKLGWNYAEDFALNGDISTKNMQKALQSKEGESRERAVLNAVLDESLRISQTQKSKESRSWFQSHENLKQSVATVNQSISRALTMISDSNLQAVKKRILDRVPVELKPEVTKSLADLTCQMADYRTQLEKSVKALKTAVNLSGHGDFEGAKKSALAAKKNADIVKQEIKTMSTELTGESLHTYSRHGRLAKSIGEWINNTKVEFSGEPKEVVEIIDRVLQGFEHDGIDTLLSKRGDPIAILGSERVKTAESEAAEKMLLWGKSAAEIMKERGDLKDYFFRWGEKNVSYAAAVSLIGGAVGEGVAALEYLAKIDPSLKPKMGLLKVALAPLTMEIGIRKLKNSVKPGQDLPFEEINQYVREESLKAAFRLATGLMPRGAKSALGAAITVGGLATGNSNLGKTVKSHFILDTAYVTGFMGVRAAADELVGEVLKGKTLSEDIQPTQELANAFDQSSVTSNTYPAIARGKGEYKEAVDVSLEKIASTPFGRDLLESMNQQQIRITMPSDNANTSDGEHDHKLSVGNYANSDKDTIFFDPQYRPSAEDIKSRPWLDCDPSVVLFHEMLHLYYSNNPIQFEVSGQTYQVGGKGDPISEHMVAGADYVSEQGVEFHFSNPEWVNQHLTAGQYVNENDLRRALNQPIREDYYFDARNTGANQARFFNPSSPDEEEPTLDVAEPEFKDKIRHYNQILPEHREPNIALETSSSDESVSARQHISSFCREPDGFQSGLPKLLSLIDSGRLSTEVSNLVREWVAEYQAGYGIDRNILERVLKDKGYAGLTDHTIVVSDEQGFTYISSLDKIMASTHLRSGYLSGYTDRTGPISKEELTDIIEQYQSMSRLIGSTYEHFRSHTDRTSASVQLYRDPIEYISEVATWTDPNTFSAVLDPDDERAFKSTLQKMDALEQALRLLYKEILGIEPPYKLDVESREDLAQLLDSFVERGSDRVDEHPEYLNYRLTRRKIEALGGDIADYLASPSHLNWPNQDNPHMAEEVQFYTAFFEDERKALNKVTKAKAELEEAKKLPTHIRFDPMMGGVPYENPTRQHRITESTGKIKVANNELSRIRDRERQFSSVVPNPERLVYAKLWRAEVREKYFNNPNLIRALEESSNAEQYLKQVEDDIENGRNAQLESDLFPFRPYQTLSKFKQGTKAELDSAYASGKLRNVYIVILSKLESVKARLSEADVTQEERQHLDKQKRILEQVEVALFADRSSLLPDVRPLLEVENADELIGVTSTTSIAPSILETKAVEYLPLVAGFLPHPVNQQALEAFLESELKKAKFNHSDDTQVIEYTLAALRNGRLGIENEDVRIFGDTDYPNLVMSSDHDIDPAFLNNFLQRNKPFEGPRYTADTRFQIKRYSSVVLDGSVSFSDLMSPDFDLSHVSVLFILDSDGNRIPSRNYSGDIFEIKGRIEYLRRVYHDEKLDSLYPEESQSSLSSDRELIDLSVRLRSGKLHFRDFISNIESRLNQTNLSDEEKSSLRLWLNKYRNAFNIDRESLSKALVALEHDIYDKIIWVSDGDKYSATTIQELVSSRELRERFQSGVVNTPEKISLSKSELDELVTLYESNLASKTAKTLPVLDAMNIGKYLSAQKDVDEAEAYDFNITVKVRVNGSQQTQTLSVPFVAAMYDIYGYLASISSKDKKYVWTGEIVDRFPPVFKQELLDIMILVDKAEESALLHEREALASQDKSIAEMEQDMHANQQARVLDLRYNDGIIRYFKSKNADLAPSNQGPLATDLVSIQGRDDVQFELLAVVRGNVPESFKSQLIKPNSLDDETWQKAQNGQLYNEIKQVIEQQDRDAEQLVRFCKEQEQKISSIQGPEKFVKNWIRRNGLDPNAQITVRAKAPLQDRFKTDPNKVREYNQKLGTPHTYTIYEVVLGKASKELDDQYRLTNIRLKWPENENLARLYERQGEMLNEYKDYIGNIRSRDADDMDRYLELVHQQEGGEKVDIKESLDKCIEALDQMTYTSGQRDIHFALEVVKQLIGVADYFLPFGPIKSYVLSTGIEVGASLLQAENASSPAEKELYRLQARNAFISNTVMSVPGVLSSKPLGSVGHRIQQSYSLPDRNSIPLPTPLKGGRKGSPGKNLWDIGKRYWSRLDKQFHSLSALGKGSNSGDFSVQDLEVYKQRLKAMKTNMTILESDSSNIKNGKQAFHEGREQATREEYRFLDEYSLKQKMDALQSNRLRNGKGNGEELNPKTKGALYQKAKSELGDVVSERYVDRADKWAKSAKSAGVDVFKILPQAKYLKLDSEGLCRPTAMLMAYAIETGNVHNFASRLENIGTQESSLFKLLNDLHGGGSTSTRDFNKLIKDMQPNGKDVGVQFKLDELSESSVFPAGCNSARIDITGEAGKGHSMSMTKAGSKYYFYEPNFGVVAFDSFDNLKSYIGNHLRSEKYGYSYFDGNANIVQLKYADNGFTNPELNGKTLLEVVSKRDAAGEAGGAVAKGARQSAEEANTEPQTRVTKGGTNGFSWPKLSGRKPDSQSLKSFITPSGDTASVVRNKVGDDFMLYTANDGVQANTLLISVHGGYHQSASLFSGAPKTGDIRVPDGVTMEFLAPHGRTLSDPSLEIMNDPSFSPHSRVTRLGHTFNPHKTGNTGSPHMYQRDVVDASGSSDVGSIKDYRIFKYQGRHSGGAETEANIVDAIINNRQGTTRATDVLTVRERTFAFSEASLSVSLREHSLQNA